MSKNKKSVIFLGFIFILVIGMSVVYMNFLKDKPLIDQQNQQVQEQTFSPGDVIKGVKGFIDTTTSNIKAPPPIKP